MTNKKKNIICVVVGIAIFGAGFFGGTLYAKNKPANQTRGQFSQNGNFGNMNGGNRGAARATGNTSNMLTGEIISKDTTSITLKLRDGGSRIVFITEKTPVLKSIAGTSNDLTANEQVVVSGTSNPDGSLSAQSIQIRPAATTTENQRQ